MLRGCAGAAPKCGYLLPNCFTRSPMSDGRFAPACTRVDNADDDAQGVSNSIWSRPRGRVMPMKFRHLSRAIACASLPFLAAVSSGAQAQHISRIVVFGDSYADI